MPRASELAADARALYGPPSTRPAAVDVGDGALWVDPGENQSVWQVQSGNWRQIALPPADDDSSIPAGVPVLRGPYVVAYSDIPHDGDTLTLWTPQVGDVLLRLFPDWQTVIQWDNGQVNIGQNVYPGGAYGNVMATTPYGHLTRSGGGSFLDIIAEAIQGGNQVDASAANYQATAYVFHTTDPVQIQLALTSGADPTMGHVELYALVARAVAP